MLQLLANSMIRSVRSLPPAVSSAFPRLCTTAPSDKFTITNIQDKADFQSAVVENPDPVVVDFHASWCGPCKMLDPRLTKAMVDVDKKILLAKVDIDKPEVEDLVMKYMVDAVPTVLAMKNGEVVDKFKGLLEEDKLNAFVKKLAAD